MLTMRFKMLTPSKAITIIFDGYMFMEFINITA